MNHVRSEGARVDVLVHPDCHTQNWQDKDAVQLDNWEG